MKYHKLTNPFTHICCQCGLTHKVHIMINKKGDMSVGFEGDIKRSVREMNKLKKQICTQCRKKFNNPLSDMCGKCFEEA